MNSSWSVTQAKSQLSELMHLARTQEPQLIGKKNPCVLVSQAQWEEAQQSKENLGDWLLAQAVEFSQREDEWPLPERGQSASRPLPFEQ